MSLRPPSVAAGQDVINAGTIDVDSDIYRPATRIVVSASPDEPLSAGGLLLVVGTPLAPMFIPNDIDALTLWYEAQALTAPTARSSRPPPTSQVSVSNVTAGPGSAVYAATGTNGHRAINHCNTAPSCSHAPLSTMAGMTGASSARARAATVDIAKGIAIIAVVFSHVTLGLQKVGLISAHFMNWSTATYLWYMCIFFFASGLFVDRSLRKDGPGRFTARKALDLGYTYIVWSLIFGLTQMVFSQYTNTGSLSFTDVLWSLLPWAPREHMWFLPALFIAFAVTAICYRLARGHWRWVLLGVSASMLALAPVFPTQNQRLQYSFWMALAALAATSAIMRWVTTQPLPQATDWLSLLTALVAFVVTVIFVIGPRRMYFDNPVTLVLATSLGILTVIALSRLLTLTGRLGTLVERIGKWSLYIYLTHVPLLAGIRVVMMRGLGIESVVAITALSVVACLAVGYVAGKLDDAGHLPWVFSLPKSVMARLTLVRPRPVAAAKHPIADR